MEDGGQMVQIRDQAGLERHVALWQNNPPPRRADRLHPQPRRGRFDRHAEHLERAYASGLRALGPAHYGPGRYAPAPARQAASPPAGRELVKEMQRLGIILDVTHLSDEAFWEALDIYDGPVWASHNNCRALVPHQRQFSDEQLKELIRRDAVIGAAFDAWMMVPGWIRGKTTPHETGVQDRDDRRPHRPHLPARRQRRGTAASAPTSTAATAPSKRRSTSTPSPTCNASPTCSPAAATARPTSRVSCTATGSGNSRKRCLRNCNRV